MSSKTVFMHSQLPSVPKENNLGMDGMEWISMSILSDSMRSQNGGNVSEWLRTDDVKDGVLLLHYGFWRQPAG